MKNTDEQTELLYWAQNEISTLENTILTQRNTTIIRVFISLLKHYIEKRKFTDIEEIKSTFYKTKA